MATAPPLVALFYMKWEDHPMKMLAQASLVSVPSIGESVSLTNGERLGYYRVTDVIHHFQAAFEESISDRDDQTGTAPTLERPTVVTLFVEPIDPPFRGLKNR